jgi:hypothetical protein
MNGVASLPSIDDLATTLIGVTAMLKGRSFDHPKPT